jgi:hypothetical protein
LFLEYNNGRDRIKAAGTAYSFYPIHDKKTACHFTCLQAILKNHQIE